MGFILTGILLGIWIVFLIGKSIYTLPRRHAMNALRKKLYAEVDRRVEERLIFDSNTHFMFSDDVTESQRTDLMAKIWDEELKKTLKGLSLRQWAEQNGFVVE